MRYWQAGCIFDTCAPTMFPLNNAYYLFALVNSKIGQLMMDIMSPTIHYTAGSMMKLPVWNSDNNFDDIVKENIEMSKQDWDSFETSWDFEGHPLI